MPAASVATAAPIPGCLTVATIQRTLNPASIVYRAVLEPSPFPVRDFPVKELQ